MGNTGVIMRSKMDISIKTIGLIVLGGAIFIMAEIFGSSLYGKDQWSRGLLFMDVMIFFGLIIISLGGFFIIRFKEIPRPGFPSTTGGVAVFVGIILIIITIWAEIGIISEISQLLLIK